MVVTIICEDKARKKEYIEHIVNNCIGIAHLPVRVLLSSSEFNRLESEMPSHLLDYSEGTDSLKSLVRGMGEYPRDEIIEAGDLKIDVGSRQVWIKGEKQHFTLKEFGILTFLAKRPNRVVSKGELYKEIFGGDGAKEKKSATLAVHIKSIRDKIESNSKLPSYIETIRGVGYRFNGQSE